MEQCEGCLKLNKIHCEALNCPIDNCWAKETDKGIYIQRLEEIINYCKLKGNMKTATAARKSIKRVKAMKGVGA